LYWAPQVCPTLGHWPPLGYSVRLTSYLNWDSCSCLCSWNVLSSTLPGAGCFCSSGSPFRQPSMASTPWPSERHSSSSSTWWISSLTLVFLSQHWPHRNYWILSLFLCLLSASITNLEISYGRNSVLITNRYSEPHRVAIITIHWANDTSLAGKLI
jgi:hypothetical protein